MRKNFKYTAKLINVKQISILMKQLSYYETNTFFL